MTIESLIRQPRPWLQRRFAASTAGAKTAIGGAASANAEAVALDRVAGALLAELRERHAAAESPAAHWADAVPHLDAAALQHPTTLSDGQLVRFRCLIQDNGYAPEIYALRRADAADVAADAADDGELASLVGCFADLVVHNVAPRELHTKLVLADRYPYFGVSVPGQAEWLAGDRDATETTNGTVTAGKKYPVPWERQLAIGALLKTYQPADWLLNEAVEVVGILDRPAAEGDAVPVIHVLFYRPLVFAGGHPRFYSVLAEDGEPFHLVGSLKPSTANGAENGQQSAGKADATATVSAAMERAQTANQQIWREALVAHGHTGDDNAAAVAEVRRALVDWLRDEVLFGDALAAEYLLVWLVARIYKRASDVSLGQFSLTLADCPVVERPRNATHESRNQVAERIAEAVRLVAAHSVLLPLNLDLLNKVTLPPKFNPSEAAFDEPTAAAADDEFMGPVEAGLLQLKSGTCLIVDETSMESGQLLERGIRNLAALQQLLTFNTIQLESEQPMEINCEADIKCLALSEGRKSLTATGASNQAQQQQQPQHNALLPTSTTIPLRPAQPVSDAALKEPVSEHLLLPLFRLYIAYVSMASGASHSYSVPEELTAEIAREFSEQRKKSRETGSEKFDEQFLSDEDLLYRLGLARLLAVSRGENALTSEVWSAMKQLEEQRFQRLASVNNEPAGM